MYVYLRFTKESPLQDWLPTLPLVAMFIRDVLVKPTFLLIMFRPIRAHLSTQGGGRARKAPRASSLQAPRADSCSLKAADTRAQTQTGAFLGNPIRVFSPRAPWGRSLRNAGVASRRGKQLSCSASVPLRSSRLLSGHLTAQLRGNHWDYVSIMIPVRCLLFAAVCVKYAETGVGEWVRSPSAEEVVQPKRLLQQIHSEEELLHGYLDTRVRNLPDGIQQGVFLWSLVSLI
ncbi:hypothetical protein CCH79_00003051 [Gambusia affinis]|uniref:Uncharacterized protein n=1 Tax=Gambusia affinis TaxID=33528 RepID=A0A315VDD6_GAMAF|nr:hypothetical protein CCH79_00003051 [Gambusia affinis]